MEYEEWYKHENIILTKVVDRAYVTLYHDCQNLKDITRNLRSHSQINCRQNNEELVTLEHSV